MTDFDPPPATELFASIGTVGDPDKDADTAAAPVPDGHYVIVGRGSAALYNHLCLRYRGQDISDGHDSPKEYTWAEKERLGWVRNELGDPAFCLDPADAYASVMHIGYREPWGNRRSERMGQHPHMLDLFRTLCPEVGLEGPAPNDWVPSSVYAETLRGVERYLRERYRAEGGGVIDRKVADGQRAGGGAPRLTFLTGFVGTIDKLDEGTADSVDLLSAGEWLDAVEKVWWERAEGRRVEDARWLNQDYPFRLNVWLHEAPDTWSHEHVYAYKIDICLGLLPDLPLRSFTKHSPGAEKIKDEGLWQELVDSVTCEDRTILRRVNAGHDYIGTEPTPNDTLLIEGGTPVGVQALQHALQMPDRRGVERVERHVVDGVHVFNFAAGKRFVSRATWCTYKGFATAGYVPAVRNLIEQIANVPLKPDDQEWMFDDEPAAVGDRGHVLALLHHHHGLDTSGVGADDPFAVRIPDLFKFSNATFKQLELEGGKLKCVYRMSGGDTTRLYAPGGLAPGAQDATGYPSEARASKDEELEAAGTSYDEVRAEAQANAKAARRRSDALGKTADDPGQPVAARNSARQEKAAFEAELKQAEAKLRELDALQKELDLTYLTVDRVVFATGGAHRDDRPGTVAFLCKKLKAPLEVLNSPLTFYAVGWHGEGGAIRVLGSAASKYKEPLPRSWTKSFATMVREAHAGGGGLNLWLPAIRRANHLLPPIVTVNNATRPELQKAGLEPFAARWIIATRKAVDRGVPVAGWVARMRSHDNPEGYVDRLRAAADALDDNDGTDRHDVWGAVLADGNGRLFVF